MGLLDNSGDIIIDAVLTDEGRKRLAEGNFKISKFALSDDEIDYSLYNKNTTTALSDIDILSTPVLEAFTNNTSSLKSKLLSIPRTNLLYLPVMKLFTGLPSTLQRAGGIFFVAVNKDSYDVFASANDVSGVLYKSSGNYILLDQGIDNGIKPHTTPLRELNSDLLETQYSIELDSRLGEVYGFKNETRATESFVDDDNIASYLFTQQGTSDFVVDENATGRELSDENNLSLSSIAGSRGTSFRFSLRAASNLTTNNDVITQLGSTTLYSGQTFYYVDTTVKVSGLTTGYRLDIPVRFMKLQGS